MFRRLFYKLMNALRAFVTITVAFFIAVGIYGAFGSFGTNGMNDILNRIVMFVFALICGMIMYLIVYYWYGKDHKCPSCNKRFCLKKTGEEVIKRENISVLVETKTKNRNGDVIGSQEQYVPGERVTYRINKVCKKCGKTCYSTYKQDIPRT